MKQSELLRLKREQQTFKPELLTFESD